VIDLRWTWWFRGGSPFGDGKVKKRKEDRVKLECEEFIIGVVALCLPLIGAAWVIAAEEMLIGFFCFVTVRTQCGGRILGAWVPIGWKPLVNKLGGGFEGARF
jgi:hypothetical protein